MPVLIPIFVLLLTTAIAPSATPDGLVPDAAVQDEAAQPKPEADAFFSGNVIEMGPDRFTVSRAILGKPPEKRTFLITASTKVEGKMRNRSRVTVRYAKAEEGDVALSVLVRESAAPKQDGKKK